MLFALPPAELAVSLGSGEGLSVYILSAKPRNGDSRTEERGLAGVTL